jgi:hypothetical protein
VRVPGLCCGESDQLLVSNTGSEEEIIEKVICFEETIPLIVK